MDDRRTQAKNIDMVSYLSSQGLQPVKEKGDNIYYLSPFRLENAPSFCVSKKSNNWIDFGREIKRKDIIDFVQEMESCSFVEALDILLGGEDLTKHEYDGPSHKPNAIEILDNQDTVTNTALVDYMERERKIPIEVVNKYCTQISFRFTNRSYITYYAVGMENSAGGFAIRSTWLKAASSPAAVTYAKTADTNQCLLFEGMTDFLSYVVLYGEPDHTCIILNSLVFVPFLFDTLKTYTLVHAWLDNDAPATEKIDLMIKEGVPLLDQRQNYEGYNDLNSYLQSK